jgi:DNA repair protein RecO (recombination protein O)
MRVGLNPSFILHRRPYRETSLLLDVFSRDYGRLNLVARGIRRKGNPRSEIIQPYQGLQIAWSGKSELMTLTNVEPDKPPYLLEKKKLLAGFYLNELLVRLLHLHEAHPELFDIYDKSLGMLADSNVEQQVVMRIFEKHLLYNTGYGLVLDHDVIMKTEIDPNTEYFYQADRGPSVARPDSNDFVKLSGKTLIALNKEKIYNEITLHESKILMRYILDKHLGHRPLASRELYKYYLESSRTGG